MTQASVGQLGVIVFAGPPSRPEPLPPRPGPGAGSREACAWEDDSSFSQHPWAEEMFKETRALPLAGQADWMLVGSEKKHPGLEPCLRASREHLQGPLASTVLRRPQSHWEASMTPFHRLANQGTTSARNPAKEPLGALVSSSEKWV